MQESSPTASPVQPGSLGEANPTRRGGSYPLSLVIAPEEQR